MILLFLGSWRSTLIVFVTIPLSILTSLAVLAALGQTINIMTLGGLALAVGMLVDDATVEVENIHRNLAMDKPLTRAILDGAQQIAVPAFVSTLSICIVFVPVLLLTGVARYLFTPLAGAVVFAMLTSYLLSRTLIPTIVRLLLPKEVDDEKNGAKQGGERRRNVLERVHDRFQQRFERLRERYKRGLEWALDHRGWVLIPFAGFVVASLGLMFADRPRLLPVRRLGPDAAARPRAGRHAHRGDRARLRRRRARDPAADPGRRAADDPRRHRTADQQPSTSRPATSRRSGPPTARS